MKILVFNWKDINHPEAGGAEVVTHELLLRLINDGHKVTLLTSRYDNSNKFDNIDGIEIIRFVGGKTFHTFVALTYYIKNLRNKYDIIIDESNTAPYFVSFFSAKEKVFLFYHQLAREIWFYQFNKFFALFGFVFLEPIALYLQAIISRLKKITTITVSQSSKDDLIRFGFKKEYIQIISEGIQNKHLENIKMDDKEDVFSVLFHSSLRPMKRPKDVITAYCIFKKNNPHSISNLWISGGGNQDDLRKISTDKSIKFFGRTTEEEKLDLMKKATVLCATSIKEGWGLIVTEANSNGTPAIVYDVDGLRDSAIQGGGIICNPKPEDLAVEIEKMYNLFTNKKKLYMNMCEYSLEQSKKITFNQSYQDFIKIIL